ncbi:hypothetical protein EU91_1060 [Prochlorococcus marinus str. GP2]|uniref:Uncharacterized protein n=1 Tax=Prochlorococcus marinus str. GP2 TaxID=59925 RepID=A0A0A1ZF43_PROMR|nr:hypothetical protein EU91_1060 [Prochlorococcus marinus str. GP2]
MKSETINKISNFNLFIIFLIIKYHCKKKFDSNYLKKFNIIKNYYLV